VSPVERHHTWDDNYQGISVRRVRISHLDSEVRLTNFINRPVACLFKKLLHEWRPDIVHFHNTTGLSLSSFLHCRLAGVPIVVTLHDHWGFCLKNTLINSVQRMCNDFSDCARCLPAVTDPDSLQSYPVESRRHYFRRRMAEVSRFITPSAYLADKYVKAGFDASRFDVVSNGINPVLPTPRQTTSKFRISTICYLGSHKGVHVVIEALSRLPKTIDWSFNIVGTGHLESALRRLTQIRGVTERVRFWGRLPNEQVSVVFAETDLYVLGSTWAENEPVSILEAMSRGIPIVATDMGGIPELVRPGINGWLVPPGDVEALRDVICEAVENPVYLKRMAEGSTRMGIRWPEARQVGQVISVYERSLNTPPDRDDRPIVGLSGKWRPEQWQRLFSSVGTQEMELDILPVDWIEPEENASVISVLQPDMLSPKELKTLLQDRASVAGAENLPQLAVETLPTSFSNQRRVFVKD
jgi:glycosyltransferase involved in cell wall biosynthesis